MDNRIPAADANRVFSRLLWEVQAGRSYVVTSHGRPVAKIVPVQSVENAVMLDARARLIARLEEQSAFDIGHWNRDELHEH